MNIISADFDLIMVNRPNERLYGKPMVELLGKKCYREFEKRDEPCPHCPGRLSLLTGGTHEAETEGLRDDGTWFSARVRTHPVRGLGDVPTGFIEVVEDITEEKRAEKLAGIETSLRAGLTRAQNVRKALTLVFTEALKVESIDQGCVLMVDAETPDERVVVRRGLSDACVAALVAALDRLAQGDMPANIPEAPGAVTAIPLLHRERPLAVMVAASSTYPSIPASLRAGLQGLAATGADAVSRILAERTRGDAIADLESVITHAPVAAFILDRAGNVTMWNKAAERLFGWKSAETLKRTCPFPELIGIQPRGSSQPMTKDCTLPTKSGGAVDARLIISAFRDVVGVSSSVIVMVEDLSLTRRTEESEVLIRQTSTQTGAAGPRADAGGQDDIGGPRFGTGATGNAGAEATGDDRRGHVPTDQRGRVLLLGPGGPQMDDLHAILSDLGYDAVPCESVEAAAQHSRAMPCALAVVELVRADGTSGLEQRGALKRLGVPLPVVLISDSPVRGYEEHGFAAVLRRPYRPDDVREALTQALGTGRGT